MKVTASQCVSASQLCACIATHCKIWRNKHVLHLGVILISNAFSFNLFQAIFYYMPSCGIQLVSIIAQKRTGAGGGRRVSWRGCNNMEMLHLNSKRAFFSKYECQKLWALQQWQGMVTWRAISGCGTWYRNILETLRRKISTFCTWMKNCSLSAPFGVRNWMKLSHISKRSPGQLDVWSCKLDVSRGGNKNPRGSSKGMLVLQRWDGIRLPHPAKCSNHLPNGLLPPHANKAPASLLHHIYKGSKIKLV